MKVHILAVGKMRAGPEQDLVRDYLARFDRTGQSLGLGPALVVEVECRKGGGVASEAILLRKAMPKGAFCVALDERGAPVTSPEFANRMMGWRADGRRDLCFIIGGADGVGSDLRDEAGFVLSFGKMVWPHMMVRAMLAEQLYRATSILAGAPYHRM